MNWFCFYFCCFSCRCCCCVSISKYF